MNKFKTLLLFLLLSGMLFVYGCSDIDKEDLKNILGDIDISEISNEEDKQIVEVFDRYGYIPLSNEYYNVNSVEEHISDDVLVLTSEYDLKYTELNEKYNSEYFEDNALILIPFKASVEEIERGITINSIYVNMQGGVIVFNIESDEFDNDEYKTITYLFEIDYSIINLDKIIGVDIESFLGFDVKITPSLFKEYVSNIQIMVNNKKTLNDIENLEGSMFYSSYKELVNKDIRTIEGYENQNVHILRNFTTNIDGEFFEEKVNVNTYRKMYLFKEALEKIKFIECDGSSETEKFLYQISFGETIIQIIDAHHFDYWIKGYYIGTFEIVEGSFAFVNKFFYSKNEAVNGFLEEIYNAIEYLTDARMVSNKKLLMLYDFCEIVRKWECFEDFKDYNIIDQLKIILENLELNQEMKLELENTILLLEDLFKDVKLKQRRFINLYVNESDFEKFKVFENEEYVLPIPTEEGLLFCGWYDEDGNVWEKGVYSFEEDINLYAKWVDSSNYQLGVCQNFSETHTYRSIKKYLGSESVVVIPTHDELGKEINYIEFAAFSKNEYIEKVYFGYTIKELDVSCFSECVNLTEVYLGKNIIDLGFYAFKSCSSLSYVYFPEGLSSTGLYTFHNCVSLESIEFPSSIDRIGANLFQGCSNLSNLSIREGGRLTSANNCIMRNNTLLVGCKNSIIPSNTEWIDDYAFYMVKFENEIILPDTLKYIDKGAFYSTSGLNKIVIPISVVSVGELAFANVLYEICVEASENANDWNERWTNMDVIYSYVN